MPSHYSGRKSLDIVRWERETVLSILATAGKAISRQEVREEYERRIGAPIAYNTVKARLDELVDAQQAHRSPENRRPVTYEFITNAVVLPASQGEAGAGDGDDASSTRDADIPLSPEARNVQKLVRRPRGERQPVSYDLNLLDDYRPGETWYLPEIDRARLRELGRTTYMDQPAGTYARDIMQRLIIDLSWGSSRLEGLRYSRIDTAELLDAGRTPAGASDRDRQLILNHKAAIEFLVEEAREIAFNRFTVLNLHGLLAENLLDDRAGEGALRTRAVMIGSSVYTPIAIPQVIEERFDTLLAKAEAIPDPIEQSFFVMVHLPYLQPFIDVNKRTSRLAANIPLIRANLCPLSFVDVPESAYTEGVLAVYELREISLLRDVFAWAYERSCAQFKVLREAMGEPNPIRLNYRPELRELVGDAVRGLWWPTIQEMQTRAEELRVPAADRSLFAEEAAKDLQALRPDVLARYALRKSEYDRWADAVAEHRAAKR
jgi:hypothetical protein